MSDLLMKLFMIALYLFEGVFIQRLFQTFAQPRWSTGKWSEYVVSMIWVMYHSICLTMNMHFYPSSVWNLLFYICILLVFTAFWYQGSMVLKLFLVMQFTAIHELSIWASNSAIYFNSKIIQLLSILAGKEILSLGMLLRLISISPLLLSIVVGIVRESMTFFSIRRIMKTYRHRQPFEKNVIPYLLPVAASVMTAMLIRLLILTVENGNVVVLYEKYPELYLIVPLLTVLLLFSNLFSFEMFQKMIGLQQERAEKLVLENQVISLQNSIAEMETIYDGVRAVKHDMKNHMLVLQTLLHEQNSAHDISSEIERYFQNMYTSVEQLDNRVHTGNPVSDAVINSKFQYAKKTIHGIRLAADELIVPDTISVEAYDIGIILSNGLDNAIEACQKLRRTKPEEDTYISIRSFWKGKMYFIEIENSFDGVMRMDTNSDWPCSTKPDSDAHGIGLRNIHSCAQKYGGDMDCIINGRRFILSVMIKGRKIAND